MKPEYRTGEKRFYDKYPEYPRRKITVDPMYEYLGCGAMMVAPKVLMIEEKKRVKQDKIKHWCIDSFSRNGQSEHFSIEDMAKAISPGILRGGKK